MLEFTHEETIDAPVEVVFDLLSDLPNYEKWNPFVTAESGIAKLDEVIKGKSFLGNMTVAYRHVIYEYKPNESIRWKDFGLPAIAVCGDRSRYLKSVDGKTHYKCYLKVSGPFSFIANLIFGEKLKNGIVAEATALKELAESQS